MSKLEQLSLRIKKFKEAFFARIDKLEEEFKEVDKALDFDNELNISEPFTAQNAPDRIKKLPPKLKDAWIKTFNSVFKDSKDEGKAFRIANAQITKMREDGIDLGEGSPVGSFEHMRDKVSEALRKKTDLFNAGKVNKGEIAPSPFIRFMFLDKIIVGFRDKTFLVPFTLKDDKVTFEKPKEVVETFQIKENKGKQTNVMNELKENGIKITKSAQNMDLDLAEFISLKEANFDEETGEVEVVLIEKGTNFNKKRHYPDSTIREAAPKFNGLKMYINHPTKTEDRERPERNLKDWGSTIVESHYDNGKAMGKIAVHDNWLRERLKDPVARGHIGLSINTGGRVSYGKVQGQEMQIVEQIVMRRQNGPASVDWVTEAGARGRVSRLLKESNKGRKTMELHEATFEDLKKENPELLNAITESVKKSIKESGESQQKEKELKESKEKLANFEKKEKLDQQKETVTKLMEGKDLQDVTKNRILEAFSRELVESEIKLKESVAAAIKTELEYLNKFSKKGKINTGSGSEGEGGLKESVQKDLDTRAGVGEKKKDKENEDE